ncbi:MAG: DNA-protecting protein DprA [Magnetococcales bacterium]|nr:DNA-protecting protein DprA [Magnetococcales bacterium]
MAIPSHILSPDAQVTLLLCGVFGAKNEAVKPLPPKGFNEVAAWLREEKLRPGDLLTKKGEKRLSKAAGDSVILETALKLLKRGAALALAVEAWSQQGVWVLCRGDKAYPKRLRERLAAAAPPLLYGAGNPENLSKGGISVVGSRAASAQSLAFTRQLAMRAAGERVQIISGGAKGVDQEAMLTALNQGGSCVGILADSLTREALSKKYRTGLQEGRLTLISPVNPEAGFNTGVAMGRNRFIYCLGDAGVVIHATPKKGGTWQGAQDNLKKSWVPLLVWDGYALPDGNRALIKQGGTPLGEKIFDPDFKLHQLYKPNDDKEESSQPAADAIPEPATQNKTIESNPQAAPPDAPPPTQESTKTSPPDFWHDHVWPTLEPLLTTPLTSAEVAGNLDVAIGQVNKWLKRGVDEGKLHKINSPVRYHLASLAGKQGTLGFDEP